MLLHVLTLQVLATSRSHLIARGFQYHHLYRHCRIRTNHYDNASAATHPTPVRSSCLARRRRIDEGETSALLFCSKSSSSSPACNDEAPILRRTIIPKQKHHHQQQHSYRVIKRYSLSVDLARNTTAAATHGIPLTRLLVEQGEFPSMTQARKACRQGRIILFPCNATTKNEAQRITLQQKEGSSNVNLVSLLREGKGEFSLWEQINSINGASKCSSAIEGLNNAEKRLARLATPSSLLFPGESLGILTRVHNHQQDDCCYPDTMTGYLFPPRLPRDCETYPRVIYQDDMVAVIDKPENLTTIGDDGRSGGPEGGGGRQDLQSMLPFLLRPPPHNKMTERKKKEKPPPTWLPRPVHRIDRRTSGLVLVAKTKYAMKHLSKEFEQRRVFKQYMAVVFDNGTANTSTNTVKPCHKERQFSQDWQVIDHPIGGKEASTRIRLVGSSSGSSNNTRQHTHGDDDDDDNINSTSTTTLFYLVEACPLTGRTHQIRRHLSYCLGLPIVGDAKYDNGVRNLRTNGMFLCSNLLDVAHPGGGGGGGEEELQVSSGKEWSLYRNCDGNNEIDTSRLRLRVEIPIPAKFDLIMGGESQ